jgi:chemotaxis protein methyltransferase CheR
MTTDASTEIRDFAFTRSDFSRVKGLIHSFAGIALNDSKESMVYSRLSRRLRALGMDSFSDYLTEVEAGGEEEREAFVNALTTNLTSFFRENHHFPILAARLKLWRDQTRIRIWCSASSTGEEPYSLAITAVEALGTQASRVEIVASDIDTNVLDRAAAAVYPADAIARMDPALARRHFLNGKGDKAGQVRVKPATRELVSFRRINLLDRTWPLQGPFDAIFCRNVMIYFDKPTQLQMLSKFVPLLSPGGLLFAGHSENLAHAREFFAPRGRTVYSRTLDSDLAFAPLSAAA